jgi:RNA polymerase sigma factor (sigma-70 family)
MAKDRSPTALERIDKAAAKLRPLERQLLVLSAAEGLSNSEIAARLGTSLQSVERLLAAALRKLDRELERQERPWWRCW